MLYFVIMLLGAALSAGRNRCVACDAASVVRCDGQRLFTAKIGCIDFCAWGRQRRVQVAGLGLFILSSIIAPSI